mgnify:CR=1 FL=1
MSGIILKISAYAGAACIAVLIVSAAAQSAPQSLSYPGKIPPSIPVTPAGGKDPFVPLAVPETAIIDKKPGVGPVLRLTAVFFSDVRPSAIINDRILYVGGMVEGQKIVDIGRTHVILHGVSGRVRLDIAGGPESQ